MYIAYDYFQCHMQVSPYVLLDLSNYACQELRVSFAVTNKAGPSNFSQPTNIIVHGGESNKCLIANYMTVVINPHCGCKA